jgi:hypothetical protein
LPSLSDSDSSPVAGLSSAFFRLPTFANLDGAMSLKMSLAACASGDFLVDAPAEAASAKPYG